MRKARASTEATTTREVTKPDEQWRQELTPLQYRVLREAHTEMAFTGAYVRNHEDGFYRCAGCGARLFSSDAKFNSGTGWPSFDQPAVAEATLATSSTTVPSRPVSGTASTRARWPSSP